MDSHKISQFDSGYGSRSRSGGIWNWPTPYCLPGYALNCPAVHHIPTTAVDDEKEDRVSRSLSRACPLWQPIDHLQTSICALSPCSWYWRPAVQLSRTSELHPHLQPKWLILAMGRLSPLSSTHWWNLSVFTELYSYPYWVFYNEYQMTFPTLLQPPAPNRKTDPGKPMEV